MGKGKVRKVQIALVAVLYAFSCLAAYHCNQAKRLPATRFFVAAFDGLCMLMIVIAASYLVRRIGELVNAGERSGKIAGAKTAEKTSGAKAAEKTSGAKAAEKTSGAEDVEAAGRAVAAGAAGEARRPRRFVPGMLHGLFEKHGKLKLFLVLFAIGMVFTIGKYPGIQTAGIKYVYYQVMGMDTIVRDLAPVQYPGVYITGHHPVVVSVLFGLFIKAGIAVGHVNWGSFALSITICALIAWGMSWVLYYFRGVLRPFFWDLVFLFLCLNPMFPSFNTYINFDGLFAMSLAVFCCLVHKVYNDPEDPAGFRRLMIWSVVIPFIKNQGIYIVLLTLLVLLILRKGFRKKILVCMLMPVLVFNILFEGLVMPACKIAPGGKQEMYTVFCQTVANAIVSYPEIIESEEYEAVHKVFPIDDWSIYDKELSDPIKFCYDPKTTSAEFKEFLKAWFKIGLQHPGCYLDAMIWQTYGYYSIDAESSGWCWEGTEVVVSKEGDTISGARFKFNHYLVDMFIVVTRNFKQRWLYSIPFAMWLSLCSIVLYRRKQTELIWFLPVVLQWLICLLSPVNGCVRYAFIVYEMAPFILAACLSSATDEAKAGEPAEIGAPV